MEKSPGTAIGYHNGRILFGEDSLLSTGRMAYVDVASQRVCYGTEIEGGTSAGGPIFSDTGDYFAVSYNGEKSVQIRIYKTEDFSLCCQKNITDENKELFYRMPHMYLVDSMHKCFVCMGGHDEIPMKEVTILY